MRHQVLADLYGIPDADQQAAIAALVRAGRDLEYASTGLAALILALSPRAVNTDLDSLSELRIVPERPDKQAAYDALGIGPWVEASPTLLRDLAVALRAAKDRMPQGEYLTNLAYVFGVDGIWAADKLTGSVLAVAE